MKKHGFFRSTFVAFCLVLLVAGCQRTTDQSATSQSTPHWPPDTMMISLGTAGPHRAAVVAAWRSAKYPWGRRSETYELVSGWMPDTTLRQKAMLLKSAQQTQQAPSGTYLMMIHTPADTTQ